MVNHVPRLSSGRQKRETLLGSGSNLGAQLRFGGDHVSHEELFEKITAHARERMRVEAEKRASRPLGQKIRDALGVLAAGAVLVGAATVAGLAALLMILAWPIALVTCVWLIARAFS